MSAVQPFDFSGQQVRVVTIDGEPWFVLADMCTVLDLSNPTVVAGRIDADDLSTAEVIDSMGRRQSARVVSESGMYAVIFQSRKPEARDFKRWITAEVLPTIRKTGTYSTVPTTPALTEDEIVHQALQIQGRKIEALTERVAELEPKAELADNYLTAKPNGRLVREVAKTFGMKEKALRAFLMEEGLIFHRQALCGDNTYDFKAEFRAHFESKEAVVTHTFGPCQHYTLYVTPRGVDLIRKRIADNRAAIVEVGS